jgi:enoyl-CoA hydratase/carnithine racemase
LAACCDLVIASETAEFGLPEINLGFVPMVVMVPISRLISQRTLQQLVLCGERISATRAQEIGLITEVCKKEGLDARVNALAEKLASRSPLALAAAKSALHDVQDIAADKALSVFSERVTLLSLSDDTQEGFAAFVEKRAPNWKTSV